MNDGQLLLYHQQQHTSSFVRLDASCGASITTHHSLFTLSNIAGYDCVAVTSTPPLVITSLRGVAQTFRIVLSLTARQK